MVKKRKYPYRFKTKEELISELGELNWRSHAAWNSDGEMDYLFGIEFPYMKYHSGNSYKITNINGSVDDRYNWSIRSVVLTEEKLTYNISYKKRKFIK